MRVFLGTVPILFVLVSTAQANLSVTGNLTSSGIAVTPNPLGFVIGGTSAFDTSTATLTAGYTYSQVLTLTAGNYGMSVSSYTGILDALRGNSPLDNLLAANAGLDSASLEAGLYDASGTNLIPGTGVVLNGPGSPACSFGYCVGAQFVFSAFNSVELSAGNYVLEETFSSTFTNVPTGVSINWGVASAGLNQVQLNNTAPTPEPSTTLLLAVSLVALLYFHRRAQTRSRSYMAS